VTTSGKHLSVSLTIFSTPTTVSVLKPLAKTTGNDTGATAPRKAESPNNRTFNTVFYYMLLDLQTQKMVFSR